MFMFMLSRKEAKIMLKKEPKRCRQRFEGIHNAPRDPSGDPKKHAREMFRNSPCQGTAELADVRPCLDDLASLSAPSETTRDPLGHPWRGTNASKSNSIKPGGLIELTQASQNRHMEATEEPRSSPEVPKRGQASSNTVVLCCVCVLG